MAGPHLLRYMSHLRRQAFSVDLLAHFEEVRITTSPTHLLHAPQAMCMNSYTLR